MLHVAVVGAGISGLTVAHRLVFDSRDRFSVTVLEASERAGGTIRSPKIEGFLCEQGPQGLLDNAADTLTIVRELGLETVESAPSARRRYLFRRGRLRSMPTSPTSAITSDVISWTAKLRLAAEPFVGAGTGEDEAIQAFAARRFGREVTEALVDPLVSGIYAGDVTHLSIRAAFPSIWELERRYGSLVKGMLAKARQRSNATPNRPRLGRLVSFRNGIEALPKAMAQSLGDRVRMSHAVTRLQPIAASDTVAGRWRVSMASSAALDADHVVIAGHPSIASRLIGTFDPELGALLDCIPSAPVVVVAIGYPRAAIDHPLDGFGFLIPRSEGLRTLGVLWESSIFPGRAPGNHVLLRAIIGGAHDPGVVTLEDTALLDVATGDLRRTLGVDVAPTFTHIVRHHIGIPQCTLGHTARLAHLDDALGRWRGLHVTGWGYRGVSVNQSIADAAAVAGRIVASASVSR